VRVPCCWGAKLSACGAQQSEPAAPAATATPAASAETVTLNVFVHENHPFDLVKPLFEAKYPNVKLNMLKNNDMNVFRTTLTAYNSLFLVYVALFTMSLYAFILSMLSFELTDLPRHFSPQLPRGWIAGVLFAVGGFLFLARLGRIITPLLQNQTPALENTTTLVIQAMDLSLIVPLAILSGILLLRRSAWGYLLASVAVLKGLTMALAVSAMGINMILAGVPDSPAIVIPFLIITLMNLVVAVLLLRNVDARLADLRPA
jgi:hypothetical protein